MGRFQGFPLICLCFAIVWYGHWTRATQVTLTNNVYENVLVAFSSNIGSASIDTFIKNLQDLLNSTSYALYNATGNRARFKDIQVLFPSTWTTNVKKPMNKRATQWDGPYPSFETADFRVDLENAAYGKYPYAQQSGGCGEPGEFIHLTTEFIADRSNLEESGKMLAMAWVRYRYGVFDEMGYPGDPTYPQMYYDSSGTAQYSVCSNTDVAWDSSSTCSDNSQIEDLKDSCKLQADPNSNRDVNTSMMAPPLLPVAYRFCNSTTHNVEAPTKQNLLCNGQSVMDVILQHPDFEGTKNPPGPDTISPVTVTPSTTGTKTNLGVILIWDPMDSMTASSAIPALAKFMQLDFPDKSIFGIIQTSAPYVDNQTWSVISNTQRDLAEKQIIGLTTSDTQLPNTDIKKAVETAISIPMDPNNARVMLVFSNYVTSQDLQDICPKAINSDSQLHLVTYSDKVAQTFLNNGSCPGRLYLIQSQTPTNIVRDDVKNCSIQLQQRNVLDNALMNLPNTILPDVFDQPVVFLQQFGVLNSTIYDSFIMDVSPSTMKTYFYAESCSDKLAGTCKPDNLIDVIFMGTEIPLLTASGTTYISSAPLNQTGQWGYSITPTDCPVNNGVSVPYSVNAAGQPIRIYGTSSTSSSGTTIEAKSWVNVTTSDTGNPVVRLYVSVKNGTTPIFNAKVMANVTSTQTDSPIATITLYDDGSGNPDTTAQDGVYSAYFTKLVKTPGQFSYSVTMNVSDDGVAVIPTTPYKWITGNDMSTVSVKPFTRTVLGDPFTAMSKGSADYYPPGPIRDFRVESVNGLKVTVAWTAPGNDYDYGTASNYIFMCVTNRNVLQTTTKLDSLSAESNVPEASPEPAKTQQTADFSGNYDSTTYYCAMQAIDSATSPNYGPVSNIISYRIVSDGGLSAASITGIVVGVILAIVVLILLGVLLWYCLRDKPTKPAPTAGAHPLIIIPPSAHQQPQGDKRKDSFGSDHTTQHSVAAPSRHDDNHSVDGSRYSHSRMGDHPQPKSNSPSLVAVPMPTIPQHRENIEHQERPDLDHFDMLQDADVAVPQKVPIRLAQIENVNEYHDARLQNRHPQQQEMEDYTNIPVYNHILNKSASSLHSYSGSSSSDNTAGRQHRS